MAGFAIRDQMNGIAEAPGKVWFWELEEAVIAADRCIQCGACIAACPSDSIGAGKDDLPALVKMCTGCSLCWDFCPRGGLRYETTWHITDGPPDDPAPATPDEAPWKLTGEAPATGLGVVQEQYTARAIDDLPRAQDGGVVSALLVALLDAGEVDGAVVAREDPAETWKAVPYVATTPEEVRACGGSFYNQTLALGHLDLAGYDLPPDPRLVLVGTPCEVQGLRAMQARPWTRWGTSHVDSVVLTVALLCTKSFNYEALMLRELRDRRGIDLDRVGRVDVLRGRLIVDDIDGHTILEEPIRDFHGAALKGCDECADFLGYGADISVGSVGSGNGYSSVLVRTPAGRDAFACVRDRLELRPLDEPSRLEKLQALDKRVALQALQRPLDPDASLFIDFEDHVATYEGSDRAPARLDR
jgi:coenzyme F420 hydrogenase subunit beta